MSSLNGNLARASGYPKGCFDLIGGCFLRGKKNLARASGVPVRFCVYEGANVNVPDKNLARASGYPKGCFDLMEAMS